MASRCTFVSITALATVCAVVLAACTFVYRCLHGTYVFLSDLHVYIAPYVSRHYSFIEADLRRLGLLRFAVITTIVLLVYTGVFWARKHYRSLLRTIDELRRNARTNTQTLARRDRSLAECRTRLEEKTEAAKNVEKRVADARQNKERDLKELRNSRLTIIQLEDQCSNMQPLVKEKNKANAEVRLLRKELAGAQSTSSTLKEAQVTASSRIKGLEAEIQAIPRWSDSNLAIFTDLRSSNATLQQEVKVLTARDKETSTQLSDSLASLKELRLHFDAERRAKDWLEIDLERKHEDARNAKQRFSSVSAELASTKTALDSANERLGLTVEKVTRLEQHVDQLEHEKADFATNEASVQAKNASLVARVAELEVLVGTDLLTEAHRATEAVAQQLEDERKRNVNLQDLAAGKERTAKFLEKENVRARKEARISGEAHTRAEEQLARVTADLSTTKHRADVLQAENAALLEGKAVMEGSLDGLLEQNGQQAAELVVRGLQGDEMRMEREVHSGALEEQWGQWGQGVTQVADSAFPVQEGTVVALQEELRATKAALEELQRFTIELEYLALTSQMPAVFPSPPVTPLAFFNPELQPAQDFSLATGMLQMPPWVSFDQVFPSSVAYDMPQPFVPLAIGQNAVSVDIQSTQNETAAQWVPQTAATIGHGTPQPTEALGAFTTENTGLAAPTPSAPPIGPQTQPQPGRREARALPRKFAGRIIQPPPSTDLPTQPTASTSAAPSSQVPTIETPASSDPMALPMWW